MGVKPYTLAIGVPGLRFSSLDDHPTETVARLRSCGKYCNSPKPANCS